MKWLRRAFAGSPDNIAIGLLIGVILFAFVAVDLLHVSVDAVFESRTCAVLFLVGLLLVLSVAQHLDEKLPWYMVRAPRVSDDPLRRAIASALGVLLGSLLGAVIYPTDLRNLYPSLGLWATVCLILILVYLVARAVTRHRANKRS